MKSCQPVMGILVIGRILSKNSHFFLRVLLLLLTNSTYAESVSMIQEVCFRSLRFHPFKNYNSICHGRGLMLQIVYISFYSYNPIYYSNRKKQRV